MSFDRQLQCVWITDLTRVVVDGGSKEIGFTAKFIFETANGDPGQGPTVMVQSAVECGDDADTFAEIEVRARRKAMSVIQRLATVTDDTLDAVIAADNAENSKTKEQRDAEFQKQLHASISKVIE